MSFNFEWDKLSKEFTEEIKLKLTSALNSKKLPAVIADVIEIQELNLGTKAPELEILEIGDLTEDRFRGIFKLTYSGDAHIVLKTKVQVNPVQVKSEHSLFTSRGMVMAHTPLVIPMLLKISDLNLRGIVVLSISKRHGITLVFKNDPLQSVQVGSSFDTFKIVQDLLQVQIENQIRNLFQEHIPAMVHNFSHLVTKNNSATPSSNSSTAVNTPQPQSPTKKKGWESPTKDYMDYKNNNNTYYTSINDHPALKDRAHLTNSNFPFHPLSTRPGFPFMRVRSSSQSSSASDELHPSAFLQHLRPQTATVYTKQNPPSAISKLGRIPQNKENRGEDLGFKFALTP